MATWKFFHRYRLLGETTRQLRAADDVDDALEILRRQARAIAECDGVAVIRRRGDRVHYVGEDSMEPLWAGQSFPIDGCVSGLAMLARAPIVIPDIAADTRVPRILYRSTFVRSMAVYPLGGSEPCAALALYWRETRPLPRDVDFLMTMLAAGTNAAFEAIARERGRALAEPMSAVAWAR